MLMDVIYWVLCFSLCHGRCFIFKPLNTELNPICHLLALLGAHHILHISRIRVKVVYEFVRAYGSLL